MIGFLHKLTRKHDTLGLSRRWSFVVATVGILKMASIFLVPVCCDFVNWVRLASIIFTQISSGRLPSVDQTGAYTGLGLFLALFFAIWSALPVPHPKVETLMGNNYFFVPSPEGYALLFMMKLPILLFDLLTAVLIQTVAKRATGSTLIGGRAFVLWYLNPLNLYLMNSGANPGAFDVIPAAGLLMAIVLCSSKRWLGAGICLAAATMLRLFPILLFPFFVVYSFGEGRQASFRLSLGFIAPIAVALLSQAYSIGSPKAAVDVVSALILRNPWVLNYYGFSIGTYLTLMPFLLLVQIYLVGRYWRERRLLVTVMLAALLVVFATTYHQPYHFIWIMPLLTAYAFIDRDTLYLFIPLCLAAFLSSEGYAPLDPTLTLLQPFFIGIFYAVKTSYLVKINLRNLYPRITQTLIAAFDRESFSGPSATNLIQ